MNTNVTRIADYIFCITFIFLKCVPVFLCFTEFEFICVYKHDIILPVRLLHESHVLNVHLFSSSASFRHDIMCAIYFNTVWYMTQLLLKSKLTPLTINVDKELKYIGCLSVINTLRYSINNKYHIYHIKRSK